MEPGAGHHSPQCRQRKGQARLIHEHAIADFALDPGNDNLRPSKDLSRNREQRFVDLRMGPCSADEAPGRSI